MARWLLLALASALCADAGRPARYADYSAARMPQYDTLYDARGASVPADDYRDRSDSAASVDYNAYDQDSNDKRNSKTLHDEDLYQIPVSKNLRKDLTSTVIDDSDADYNLKSEENIPKNRNSNKRPRNIHKIQGNEMIDRRSKISRNAKKGLLTAQDDEDNETPLEHTEEDKYSGSDTEKGKFVRRDIRQNARRTWYPKSSTVRESDYDDQSEGRQGKAAKKLDGPIYTDPELMQNAPNVEPDDARSPERSRPPAYKAMADDNDDSETPSALKHKAPMPKSKKKSSEYVDYNDMNRIEKIKNLPTRSTTDAATETSLVTKGSAAERELQALLGRKEAAAALGPDPPPTLRPDAVDAYHEARWTQFIINNRTPRLQLSTYVYLLTLIHYLQIYTEMNLIIYL